MKLIKNLIRKFVEGARTANKTIPNKSQKRQSQYAYGIPTYRITEKGVQRLKKTGDPILAHEAWLMLVALSKGECTLIELQEACPRLPSGVSERQYAERYADDLVSYGLAIKKENIITVGTGAAHVWDAKRQRYKSQ